MIFTSLILNNLILWIGVEPKLQIQDYFFKV